MKNKLLWRGLWQSVGVTVYISLVAAFFRNVGRIFGQNKPDTILAPMLILTLFVLSAGITGSLVLGKSVLLYFENQKADAVKLFFYTLGWLFVIVGIILVSNIIVMR